MFHSVVSGAPVMAHTIAKLENVFETVDINCANLYYFVLNRLLFR